MPPASRCSSHIGFTVWLHSLTIFKWWCCVQDFAAVLAVSVQVVGWVRVVRLGRTGPTSLAQGPRVLCTGGRAPCAKANKGRVRHLLADACGGRKPGDTGQWALGQVEVGVARCPCPPPHCLGQGPSHVRVGISTLL